MHNHQLSRADYEGNLYEWSRPGMGRALGQLPSHLLTPLQIGSEEVNGLAHVPVAAKPAAKLALEQMVFEKQPAPEIGGQSGTAAFIMGSPGSPWVSELVGKGYVVMIDRNTLPSGNIEVMATDQPATVALFAGRPNQVGGAEWVIVDADPVALSAAEAVATGQPPPPGPGGGLPTIPGVPSGNCPAGQIDVAGQCLSTPPCPAGTNEVFGVCFPAIPGTTPPGTTPPSTVPPGQQPPGEPPETTETAGIDKKWLIGGAAVLGVAAVGALLVRSKRSGSGKPRSEAQVMAANRRHAYPREWR